MDVAQTAGIGAICLALIGLIWKIWHDKTEQDKILIDTIKANTEAQTKAAISNDTLARNVSTNTEFLRKQGQSTIELLTKLTNIIRPNGHDVS